MSEITLVGNHLTKDVISVHEADGAGCALLMSVFGMFMGAIFSTRH